MYLITRKWFLTLRYEKNLSLQLFLDFQRSELLKSTGIDLFFLTQLTSRNFLSRIFLRNRVSRYTSITLHKIMEMLMCASSRIYCVRSVTISDHFDVYVLQEGERGYLEGLASRYADLFSTHYGDVLEPLEELRRRETNSSARMPSTQLTTSHSQPIYVPGKYSVSKSLIFAFICPLPGRRFSPFIASAGSIMRL